MFCKKILHKFLHPSNLQLRNIYCYKKVLAEQLFGHIKLVNYVPHLSHINVCLERLSCLIEVFFACKDTLSNEKIKSTKSYSA